MGFRVSRVDEFPKALVVLFVWGALLGEARAENWPRFRGENGSGVSAEKGLPKTWSTGDYAWNIELPGEGHSSPVIWDDRVFLSSAVDEGAVRYLLCLDAKTGDTRWSQPFGFNRSHKHAKSSWASATPTTDGERVYVAFADREKYQLTACDFDGNVVWQRDLGPYETGRQGHPVRHRRAEGGSAQGPRAQRLVLRQYWDWLTGFVLGDFGNYYLPNTTPVSDSLSSALPAGSS